MSDEYTTLALIETLEEVRDERDQAINEMNAWHERTTELLAERDQLKALVGNFATRSLHMPLVEGDGEDGVTVHAWAPGYSMGCPVCAALDSVLNDAN